MTAHHVGAGSGTRGLRSIVGPEVVAAILVGLGIIVGVVAVNRPLGIATGPSTPGPSVIGAVGSPTPAPSSSPSTPTPTATPSASPTAGVGGIVATPRPRATPTPISWVSQADSTLVAGSRVVAARADLRAALDRVPVSADDVSRRLREANSNLAIALTSVRALERSGAPSSVTAPLRGLLTLASDASLETLKLPLADLTGFTAGGELVVATIAPIETRLNDLAAAAGIADPYPLAVPSPTPTP